MDEDEKLFMKFVEDGYRLSTGTELEGWQKSTFLQWYRFNKLYPNAEIVMGRKGPIVVIPKEERNDILQKRLEDYPWIKEENDGNN